MAGGQKCEWSVHASPDGSLEDLNTGKEYPYLFWEAAAVDNRVTRSFGLEDTKSFCVAGDAAGEIYGCSYARAGRMRNGKKRELPWTCMFAHTAYCVCPTTERRAQLGVQKNPKVTDRGLTPTGEQLFRGGAFRSHARGSGGIVEGTCCSSWH